MYWTIWLSLTLFAAGEIAKARRWTWGWWAWAAGVALCAVHVAIAMAVAHGWSHASAVAATARATNAVFGLNWGGGVYANYLFVAVWAAETIWWRARPISYMRRPPNAMWAIRAFYFVIILNAAVIFASRTTRPIGVVIVALLLALWTRPPRPDA